MLETTKRLATYEDMRLPETLDLTSLTAGQVMTRNPATVHYGATLWSAWDMLHAGDYHHLVVVDDERQPVGVLDQTRIALEWPPGPMGPHRMQVSDALGHHLTPRVAFHTSIAAVAATMLGTETNALPVVDRAGRLIGLVTSWHLLALIARAV